MPTGSQLGVDFGTSHTVAVVRRDGGPARALLFEGSPLLPSAVFAEPDLADPTRGLIVGRDALHSARSAPGALEPNPKRRIDERELLLGDRVVPLGDAVSAVLRHVVAEYHRTVGGPPDQVTLTCPANWGATRRFVLADAARAAGLPTVRLVAEPVAAATYFALGLGHHVPVGAAVVVYDLGAGTFDASVVAHTGGGFEVLAVDGLDTVGGLDLDELVLQLVGARCPPDGWHRLTHPADPADRRAAYELREQVRTAKERLSRAAAVTVHVPLVDLDVIVTREELQQKAEPLLDQTIRVTNSVIRFARLVPEQVVGIFLVGGASRMPLVATMLHRAFGRAPIVLEQPELVVAEGCVLVPDSGAMPGGAEPVTVTTQPTPAPTSPPAAPTPPAPPMAAPMAPPMAAPTAPMVVSGPPIGAAPPLRPGPSEPAPAAAPRSFAPTTGALPPPFQPSRPQPQPQQPQPQHQPQHQQPPQQQPQPQQPLMPIWPQLPPGPVVPIKPPKAVRAAVIVLWVVAACNLLVIGFAVTAAIRGNYSAGSQAAGLIAALSIYTVLSVTAAVAVGRAARWARVFIAVTCALTLLVSAFLGLGLYGIVVLTALWAAATVLVNVPSSRRWFGRRPRTPGPWQA